MSTVSKNHALLFITILTTIVLAGAEVDLFIPSFPELMQTFDLTPALVQLTLSINFLSYCISSLFVGNFGDRYGSRPLILGGLVIFVMGSLFCVFTASFPLLILGRFLQGLGMAGPAVLAYVVISDIIPLEKQPSVMGTLNGAITLAMAFAPIAGSYINMFFGWRGSFVLLLGLGILSLVLCFFFIPQSKKTNPHVSLSLREYLPLLKSTLFMKYFFIMCSLIACYWVFIGMAPILYMKDLGVPLSKFGFYQGTIAVVFSIMSFASPLFLKKYSHKACIRISMFLLLTNILNLLIVAVFLTDTAWIITALVSFYSLGFVLPVNILYPIVLETIPDSKGKAAALVNFGRLFFSAGGVAIVSYFYTGTFLPIAFFIFVFSVL
jgi:MFS transporter, DHA1 family, multidrug resistance protein